MFFIRTAKNGESVYIIVVTYILNKCTIAMLNTFATGEFICAKRKQEISNMMVSEKVEKN